jgi:putative metallohydrolase (TIGR04338 family)
MTMTSTKAHAATSLDRAENVLYDILDRASQAPTVQIHGSTVVVPVERKFGDLPSVQRYVDRVLSLNWVRGTYPAAGPVRVRERKGHTSAHYSGGEIAVPVPHHASRRNWAMREMVILHELAHHLAGTGCGHDARFADALVSLVTGVMGDEAGFLLRALFYDEGVKIG